MVGVWPIIANYVTQHNDALGISMYQRNIAHSQIEWA